MAALPVIRAIRRDGFSYLRSSSLICIVFAFFLNRMHFGEALYDNPVQNIVPNRVNQPQNTPKKSFVVT